MSEVLAPNLQSSGSINADSFETDFDRLRDECGLIELTDVAVIELTGDDRKGWLQGQSTNDLRQLDNGANFGFCLCEPTGQMISVCEIWGLADRFILVVPKSTLANVLKRFETMVVMEDIVARDMTEETVVLSVQGPTATRELGELVTLPLLDAGVGEIDGVSVIFLRSNRTGLGGWDLVVPKAGKKAINKLRKRFQPVGFEAFGAARLEAGRPVFGLDMDEKTLPPEMGQAFELRHVSYNKGCYVGQEVLMRIHSRGHTNKRWVGLLADDELEVGATVASRNRADAGIVTSVAFSPDRGYIGAAMLRNEVSDDGEQVSVNTSRGPVAAEVRRMPLLRFD